MVQEEEPEKPEALMQEPPLRTGFSETAEAKKRIEPSVAEPLAFWRL